MLHSHPDSGLDPFCKQRDGGAGVSLEVQGRKCNKLGINGQKEANYELHIV